MSPAMALLTMQSPWLTILCIQLFASTVVSQMPNNPTQVLQHENRLYVFRPSPDTVGEFELSTVDVSSRVDSANVPFTTLYSSLPFLNKNAPSAFTPLLDNNGTITVYTGDCSQGASGGKTWGFTPPPANAKGTGTWKQKDVSVKESKQNAMMGANYLSGGMTFSSVVGSDPTTTSAYIFGGMCPFTNGKTNNWQSSANYSNIMITLQPSGGGSNNVKYAMDFSASRGPPVPEAGFTVTGLTPTFSNFSDGTQTQQQNFLLIGGHTSAAFINMSQVALFSLPEQSWTFIGAKQPETSRTDLAVRSGVTTVDPRSGHTAVLTPDGQRIIVFGGWVGDINTPADPQLAVLNVADGFGGKGDWQWKVPSTSGAGLPSDSGLYGHGAAMLPGGVMMITGGHAISSTSSRQRRATPTANTKTYFLNITSNAWVTDYSPPPDMATPGPINNGPLSSPGQKAGLGVGIGIGLAAVCGLFAFYMWYARRLKKQREVREKQIQDLSFTTHRYNIDHYSPGFDGRSHSDASDYLAGQNGNYYFPPGTQGGQGWRQANGGDAERTGLLVEIPSPTRGLRRSLSGRPGFAGRMRGPGQIHPIDELEEEQDNEHSKAHLPVDSQLGNTEKSSDRKTSVLDNAPELDPFIESRQYNGKQKGIFSISPKSPRNEDPTEHDHPSNWPLDESVLGHQTSKSQNGRLSPDKSTSERTGSNLSDRSTRSGLSWSSSSGGGMGRSASMRSAAILNNATHNNPFRTPDGSPTREGHERLIENGRQSPTDPRTHSMTSIRSTGYADSEIFRTAHSSFAHLQAEGEALLGGNPERARPDTSSSNSNTYRDTEGTNSRAATATPATSIALESLSRPVTRERRRSWLGSVRRVLTRSASGAERTRSMTTAMVYHEPYSDHPAESIDTSAKDNRKSFPAVSGPPRRAASDASFWRSRRGRQDWLEDEQDSTWKRTAGDDWGAPEDIAHAERERQRQEWRERGKLLVNIASDDDQLPTPRTPIRPDQLGVPASDDRPCTPASEADWDVEAAVERRVVQVMFTVPKSKLRVVNADIDGSSILSLPRENSKDDVTSENGGSPSRVKDLAGKFEQMSSPRMTPRASPRPSPAPSIKSMKIRSKASSTSLAKQSVRKGSGQSPLAKAQGEEAEEL